MNFIAFIHTDKCLSAVYPNEAKTEQNEKAEKGECSRNNEEKRE